MKPAATFLLGSATAFVAAAFLAASIWYGYDSLAHRPIVAVRFAGDTARVPAADLNRLAAGLRGREVALPAVRDAVRRVPWVRDCTVRHVFPGTLKVTIEAHSPLARWDETRLVSTRGEVFAADFGDVLPRFAGPEGTAAEMVAAWKAIRRAAEPLAIPIVELRLSARRAWQARLGSGLAIELGRGEIAARLARFAAAWPRIAAEAGTATHADLRYPNGFALRGVADANRKPAPKSGPA